MRVLALLAGLAVAAALVAAAVVLDLVAHPRDVWAGLCFLAGTLAGAVLDRRGRTR